MRACSCCHGILCLIETSLITRRINNQLQSFRLILRCLTLHSNRRCFRFDKTFGLSPTVCYLPLSLVKILPLPSDLLPRSGSAWQRRQRSTLAFVAKSLVFFFFLVRYNVGASTTLLSVNKRVRFQLKIIQDFFLGFSKIYSQIVLY